MGKKKMHSQHQVAAFLEEVNSQTDRGAAVVSASVLDEILQLVILARLIELSSERREALLDAKGAPLATFSAKIEMAYALGLISNDARLALHLVRDIRNKFAHRIEQITFDHPEIKTLLDTRASKSVRASNVPYKRKFINSFQAIVVILYGTLSMDIRIKSLQETHQADFLKIILEAQRLSDAANPSQPPDTAPGDPPT